MADKVVSTGFQIELRTYTDDGRAILRHPDRVRELIGKALDAHGVEEEIDYTLSIKRLYES